MPGPPSGKFHCWIPYRWKFEHPWKYQGAFPVSPELETFTFTHIAHATHTEEKNGIIDKEGIKAEQWDIKKRCRYSYQQLDSLAPKQLTEDKVFPGYYVFFAPIIPELDSKQKKACLTLIKRFGWGVGSTEFSDYIEHHNRYGNWMFPMTIDEAIKLYKYSVEQEMKTRKVEEIKFKLMGTNRYKWSVAYVVAVTARLAGEEKDPLHEYQDWNIASLYHHKGDTAIESDRETAEGEPPPKKKKLEASKGTQSHDREGPSHVTRTKIVFNPKAVVCIEKENYYTRDHIEIAFHFRNPESVFHLKIPELDRSQPQEVFHCVCVRSLVKGETCEERKPKSEWGTNQKKRLLT